MNTKFLPSLIGLFLIALLLAACGGQAAEPVDEVLPAATSRPADRDRRPPDSNARPTHGPPTTPVPPTRNTYPAHGDALPIHGRCGKFVSTSKRAMSPWYTITRQTKSS
jgi:hypothetical protein